MTGGEAAAAAAVGKVVKSAGEHVADEHKNIKQELLSAAKESPHMADAAENYARTIAIRQAIVTKMYERVAKWFGVATDYFEGEFNHDMAEKLKNVPEDHISSPKPSLAAPAMQQLAYSLDEPNLKEMYLNLLATASDDRSSEDAHPSFVDVVKQLSSHEATFLNMVLDGGGRAIVTYVLETEGEVGKTTLKRHVMEIVDQETLKPSEMPRIAAYVDNWIRLGLVEVNYSAYMTAENAYDWATDRPEYTRLNESLAPKESVTITRGFIRPTDFGIAFARAVGVLG